MELILVETDSEISPLHAHMIASTFERYLKDTLLTVAVEDFFLSWPQPSSEEIDEQHRIQMQQQMAEINTLYGEDELPEEEEDDLDGLPVDDGAPLPKKKKKKKVKVKKKKVGKKKIIKKKKPSKD